ncbi:hypothetical protein [Flavilitoribacter nigricans]|nr:hypothetical protein [Flavilitoribacter nigricans]
MGNSIAQWLGAIASSSFAATILDYQVAIGIDDIIDLIANWLIGG